MSNLSAEDVGRLRELLEKATPGPWIAETTGYAIGISAPVMVRHARGLEYWICERVNGSRIHGVATGRPTDNAELIAAAINSLPALLQLAEAVMRAPVGMIAFSDVRGRIDWYYEGGAEVCPTEALRDGQRVRLVPVSSGEGG